MFLFFRLILLTLIAHVPCYGAAPSVECQCFNLSPQIPYFVGRKLELNKITGILNTAHKNVIALVGLPGVGKTALAKEYVKQNLANYKIVLWLDCTVDIKSQLVKFGKKWNKQNKEPEFRISASYLHRDSALLILKEWLPKLPIKCLVIFDDLQDCPEHKECFTPFLDAVLKNVILTTKRSNIWGIDLKVEKLKRGESIELLKKFISKDQKNLGSLASILGDYPLVLVQAGAMIKNISTMSVEEYANLFQKQRAYLESLQERVNQKTQEITDYNLSLSAALELSLSELEKKSKITLKLLEYMSFLNSSVISETLMRDFLVLNEQDPSTVHETVFDLTSSCLLSLQECKTQEKESFYNQHDLIQLAIKSRLTLQHQKEAYAYWVAYFRSKLPLETNQLQQTLIEHPEYYYHIKKIISQLSAEPFKVEGYAALKIDLLLASIFYMTDYDFGNALAHQFEQEVENGEKITNKFSEGRFYHVLGNSILLTNPERAIELTLKAQKILKALPDPAAKSEWIFVTLNSLADYYLMKGQLSEALKSLDAVKIPLKEFDNSTYDVVYYAVLSFALINKGEISQALESIHQSEIKAQKKGCSDKYFLFISIMKALINMKQGKHEESLQIARAAFKEMQKNYISPLNHKSINLRLIMYYNLFKLHKENKSLFNNVQQAIEDYNRLANGTHKSTVQAFGYILLGDIYETNADYHSALREYLYAQEIYDHIFQTKEMDELSELYSKITLLGIKIKDHSLAKRYFQLQYNNFGLDHHRTLGIAGYLDQQKLPVPW